MQFNCKSLGARKTELLRRLAVTKPDVTCSKKQELPKTTLTNAFLGISHADKIRQMTAHQHSRCILIRDWMALPPLRPERAPREPQVDPAGPVSAVAQLPVITGALAAGCESAARLAPHQQAHRPRHRLQPWPRRRRATDRLQESDPTVAYLP